MIIEVLDYCVNTLNGPFYETFNYFSYHPTFFYILSLLSCLWIGIAGILTYNFSFVYLSHLIFFNIFNTLNKNIQQSLRRYKTNILVNIILRVLFHEIIFAIILAVLKFQIYVFVSFPEVSLAGKFCYAIVSITFEKVEITEIKHTLQFLCTRILLFAIKYTSDYFYVQMNCILFTYGGAYYFIENFNKILSFPDVFGFTLQYNLYLFGHKDTIFSYVVFLSVFLQMLVIHISIARIYVRNGMNSKL